MVQERSLRGRRGGGGVGGGWYRGINCKKCMLRSRNRNLKTASALPKTGNTNLANVKTFVLPFSIFCDI